MTSRCAALVLAVLCLTYGASASAALACAEQRDGPTPVSASVWPVAHTSAAPQPGINRRYSCTITHISDGDSVTCEPLGRIRLLLIDAPEMADREIGRQARSELLAMMPVGTKVVAETDVRVTDRYGRVLAYLFLPDGELINERMAESGYVTTLVYPPNVKYVERIRAGVERARKAGRGLWATGGFDCAPRDYRLGRCR